MSLGDLENRILLFVHLALFPVLHRQAETEIKNPASRTPSVGYTKPFCLLKYMHTGRIVLRKYLPPFWKANINKYQLPRSGRQSPVPNVIQERDVREPVNQG